MAFSRGGGEKPGMAANPVVAVYETELRIAEFQGCLRSLIYFPSCTGLYHLRHKKKVKLTENLH
jgi:hypothetical protein